MNLYRQKRTFSRFTLLVFFLAALMGCSPRERVEPAIFTQTPASTIVADTLTDSPTEIPVSNTLLPPTNTPVPGCIELLKQSWRLEGTGPQEAYEHETDPKGLMGKSFIRITYDLHGLSAMPADASALIFDQPFGGAWHYISLSEYGQNGSNGSQTVDIPLSDFAELDISQPVGTLHTRFWHTENYVIDVTSVMACS